MSSVGNLNVERIVRMCQFLLYITHKTKLENKLFYFMYIKHME